MGFEAEGGGPLFNISLEGGCLSCGQPCLSAVESAMPACVVPGLAVGGTVAGGAIDLSITSDVFRNRGDGLDDEECPEKETFGWELRSSKAPKMGWFKDTELVLEKFLQDEDILVNLVPDVEIEQ